MSSNSSLQQDLEWLQDEHDVQDSLIESLQAASDQARAHIAFWTRMMWLLNGVPLAIAGTAVLFAARWALGARSLLSLGVVLLLCALAVQLFGVLHRQRRALAAIRNVTDRHGLV